MEVLRIGIMYFTVIKQNSKKQADTIQVLYIVMLLFLQALFKKVCLRIKQLWNWESEGNLSHAATCHPATNDTGSQHSPCGIYLACKRINIELAKEWKREPFLDLPVTLCTKSNFTKLVVRKGG